MSKAKKVLALVLAVMMLFTMASFPAFAAESQKLDLENIATIKTTASSQKAEDMVDGDLETYWSDNWGSKIVPVIDFELQVPCDLDKIVMYVGNNKTPQGIKIEAAGEDGVYSTVVDEDYSSKWGACWAPQTVTYDGLALKAVKYVRITLTKYPDDYESRIREVEMYGTYIPNDPVNYTVRYVDDMGKDIIPAIEKVGENGATVVARAKTEKQDAAFGGMILQSADKLSITLDKTKTNEIVFNYKNPDPMEYTVSYLDSKGNKLVDDAKKSVKYPFEVTELPKAIAGYFSPAVVTKKITETDNTIVFTYYRNMSDDPLKVGVSEITPFEKGFNGGKDIMNMVDDDPSTLWRASSWSRKGNIVFTLDYPVNLAEVNILWGSNANGSVCWTGDDTTATWSGTRATVYDIYVSASDNGDDFVLAYTFDGNKATNNDRLTMTNVLQAKRVKLQFTDTASGNLSIKDISFKGYVRCDVIADAGDLNLLYKSGTKELKFPITVCTLDNVNPEANFVKEKWSIAGGTITSVTCVPSASTRDDCYTWDVLVTVAPNDGADVMMDLNLPASYIANPSLHFTRTAAEDQFDTSIMDGENSITFNLKNIRNITVDGVAFDTVEAYIRTQVPKAGATYNGYTDLSLEVLSVDNDGNIFSNDVFKMSIDKFMKVENGYYVANVPYKKNADGVDRLRAVIVLYGKNAKDEKVEIDRVTVVSETVETSYTAPVEQTDAQKMKDHTTIFDILNQLYAQVASYDLPNFTDEDWNFYRALLATRGTSDEKAEGETESPLDKAVKAAKELHAAKRAADKAATTKDLVIDLPNSGVSTYFCWNYLKNLHADSITFIAHGIQAIPGGVTAYPEYYFNGAWTKYSITIKSEDYTRLNYDGGATYFKLDMKPLINFDNKGVDSAAAYNSILRSFGSNQIVPLICRLDWAPWAGGKISTPFDKATINLTLPSGWIENYGNREIAVYRTGDYKRSDDNDVTLTLVSDNIAPDVAYDSATNTYTHTLHFEVPANKLWDTYAIINTSKITNTAPSIIGGSEVKDVPVTGGDLAE